MLSMAALYFSAVVKDAISQLNAGKLLAILDKQDERPVSDS